VRRDQGKVLGRPLPRRLALDQATKFAATLVGGGSCQAIAEGVFGPPVVAGPVGFVQPYGESVGWPWRPH
jgi:hypothetical protein